MDIQNFFEFVNDPQVKDLTVAKLFIDLLNIYSPLVTQEDTKRMIDMIRKVRPKSALLITVTLEIKGILKEQKIAYAFA